jgi:predicted transposase YdaD
MRQKREQEQRAMSKPFDATLKDMAGIDPGRFLAEIDAPPTLPVRLLNADLSTVTAATDLVFGLGEPLQEVIHLDAQAGPDADKHRDLLAYHALLHRQYRVPVHSILLLLRPQAVLRSQTGNISYTPRPGKGKMDWDYEIIPLWERPVEQLLDSGLATLPLAPLCRLPEGMSLEDGMRWVLSRIVERLDREGDPALVQRLLTATFVLMGLRLDRKQVRVLFQGVRKMRESDTYQAILDEGEVRGLQDTLLRLGRKRFGEPDETVRQTVLAIEDLVQLKRLTEDLLDVTTWQELLARVRP